MADGEEPKFKQPVYLICGTPGSGKTWISRQMARKAIYVPHDLHNDDQVEVILDKLKTADRPIITESPFMEKVIRARLRDAGVKVNPYVVVESPLTVKKRYEAREGKPIPKMHLTRSRSIISRAREWQCPYGGSSELLEVVNKDIPELTEHQKPSDPLPPTREQWEAEQEALKKNKNWKATKVEEIFNRKKR